MTSVPPTSVAMDVAFVFAPRLARDGAWTPTQVLSSPPLDPTEVPTNRRQCAVAFSRDAHRVLTAGSDETVRIWHAATGGEIATLKGHEGFVSKASFSSDGRRVLTIGSDNTVRFWDVSKSLVMARRPIDVVLAASLSAGVGRRTDREATHLLVQNAPEDLFEACLAHLGRTPGDRELLEIAAALHAPLHPNCYLRHLKCERRGALDNRGLFGSLRRATRSGSAWATGPHTKDFGSVSHSAVLLRGGARWLVGLTREHAIQPTRNGERVTERQRDSSQSLEARSRSRLSRRAPDGSSRQSSKQSSTTSSGF
jgi:hypothetical protein